MLSYQGGEEGGSVTTENPACHCCHCGQRQFSTSQLQHKPSPAPPPPAAQHISLPTRFGEVHGQQRASGAEQCWDPWLSLALPQHSPVRDLWCSGSTEGLQGVAGLPYREQYHSFWQREQRLPASAPHTLQRGLSGARASIMSRL